MSEPEPVTAKDPPEHLKEQQAAFNAGMTVPSPFSSVSMCYATLRARTCGGPGEGGGVEGMSREQQWGMAHLRQAEPARLTPPCHTLVHHIIGHQKESLKLHIS